MTATLVEDDGPRLPKIGDIIEVDGWGPTLFKVDRVRAKYGMVEVLSYPDGTFHGAVALDKIRPYRRGGAS